MVTFLFLKNKDSANRMQWPKKSRRILFGIAKVQPILYKDNQKGWYFMRIINPNLFSLQKFYRTAIIEKIRYLILYTYKYFALIYRFIKTNFSTTLIVIWKDAVYDMKSGTLGVVKCHFRHAKKAIYESKNATFITHWLSTLFQDSIYLL